MLPSRHACPRPLSLSSSLLPSPSSHPLLSCCLCLFWLSPLFSCLLCPLLCPPHPPPPDSLFNVRLSHPISTLLVLHGLGILSDRTENRMVIFSTPGTPWRPTLMTLRRVLLVLVHVPVLAEEYLSLMQRLVQSVYLRWKGLPPLPPIPLYKEQYSGMRTIIQAIATAIGAVTAVAAVQGMWPAPVVYVKRMVPSYPGDPDKPYVEIRFGNVGSGPMYIHDVYWTLNRERIDKISSCLGGETGDKWRILTQGFVGQRGGRAFAHGRGSEAVIPIFKARPREEFENDPAWFIAVDKKLREGNLSLVVHYSFFDVSPLNRITSKKTLPVYVEQRTTKPTQKDDSCASAVAQPHAA